jgi:small-conductance mechanosensitive channel
MRRSDAPTATRFLGLALAALGLVWLALAPPALAQSGDAVTLTLRGGETQDEIRKALDALAASGRKVEVRFAERGAGVPPAAPAQAAAPEGSRVETFWQNFVEGFDYGNAAIPKIAELPGDWSRGWAANLNGRAAPSAGWRIVLILIAAAAAALVWRAATRGWFARRLAPKGPEFTPRLLASAAGALQDLTTAVVAFGLIRLGRRLLLPEADLASFTVDALVQALTYTAIYLVTGRLLLSPGAPERRLLPLPRAERHFRLLVFYALFGPLILMATALGLQVAGDRASVAGLFAINGLAITLFKIWWFWDARHDLTALVLRHSASPGPGLRLLARLTPWLYIASAIVIWMVGRAAAMMTDGARWGGAAGLTQFIVVLAPIAAVGVSALIGCARARQAADAEPTPMAGAAGRVMQAAAAGLIWIGAAYWLVALRAGFFVDTASADYAAFRRQAFGVAALVFTGWVAIVFLRGFFDAYAPKPRSALPAEEDAVEEEHVPSRLATVLPVIRGVVLGGVFGVVGLVVLSRLGVDIGPLLAGFGILGLAISFGSQALVRDIVSGFFFMVEDAFRVGEYVDTGRLKGTVEKISLRSMQLRHQSGQIHTVPFGQIPSLTNASRDWATLKFNVRLDHSADIEKARKTIKKTGLALLEDPEFAPHFIAQLKMQGVADITDSAIVIRLKFTAKPNHASTLQREALKRVYRALNEAGVPFASNAVTVRGGEGGQQAGAAAAISAVPPPTPLAPAAG